MRNPDPIAYLLAARIPTQRPHDPMYTDHRQQFLAQLQGIGACALIPTNPTRTRSADTEFRFRPSSDFWYLTGFAEPDSWLLLLPAPKGSDEPHRSILFLREKDKTMEIWNGLRLGVTDAPSKLGVDEAYDVEDLWSRLPELLEGHKRLVFATGLCNDNDAALLKTLSGLRDRVRGGVQAPMEILDPGPLLHELRLFKTPGEIEVMRKAAAITDEAHREVMATTRPGTNECELDALLEYTFRRKGGTGAAYGNIVAGGANACILHYVENNATLQDGDICLVDAGCEFDFYASDVTRSFPISGQFTEAQKSVYAVVLNAQLAAIDQCKPGNTFLSVHEVALGVLVRGLIELGLCKGTPDEVLEDESYREWYMHRTGHWMGLDVHDCGSYHKGSDSRPLEPGMVLTVEPGIYIAADAQNAPSALRGIGIRIEDDILITADGHENLSAAIPKTIEDVEAACALVTQG